MKIKLNKKAQLEYVSSVAILSLIVLTSGILFANNLTSNSTIILTGNIIEKSAEIEIWANTFLTLEIINNNIGAFLSLDNQTILPEQEIEFYLDNNLISKEITNSAGYAPIFFNATDSGNYSLKAIFQGNYPLYLNPSHNEMLIEIIEQNETRKIKAIEENFTMLNITFEMNATNITLVFPNRTLLSVYTDKPNYLKNETINIFGELINGYNKLNLEIRFNNNSVYNAKISDINKSYAHSLIASFENSGDYLVLASSGNLSAETGFYFSNTTLINLDGCMEFKENIMWSSRYSNKPQGSTTYQTWEPEHNCAEVNVSNCFLENIEIKTRFLYFGEDSEIGEGYVQISESDKSICDEPEKGNYLQHLSYEKLKGESRSFEQYCGKSKKTKEKCESEILSYKNYEKCYGIKAYGSQYMLVDVFEIKYHLCREKGNG